MATKKTETVLAVSCPNCQAKPGEPCTQPTDTGRRPVAFVHSARITAFEDVRERGELE